MSQMRNYCDCGDYCEWCHPEMCGYRPRVGDCTVVEQWDGERWVERRLYWNGIAYVPNHRRSETPCKHNQTRGSIKTTRPQPNERNKP
jgi:hypothetical protein